MSVVAFAYDICTRPSNNNVGAPRNAYDTTGHVLGVFICERSPVMAIQVHWTTPSRARNEKMRPKAGEKPLHVGPRRTHSTQARSPQKLS